jgi:tripartite-type tricarboxylate transporter receptor subunit TctC
MVLSLRETSCRDLRFAIVAALSIGAGPARADSNVADFYRGKTVTMVIGSASGGGFDAYARIIAPYMTKYLPGQPTVVPQNLAGGGGYSAGYRVAVSAPQDGTFIAAVHPTTIVDPILGDSRKRAKPLDFAYLGSASADLEACFLRTDAPAKSFQDGFNTEIILGAGNQASSSREYPALLKSVLGMKITIVGGYSGTNQIMLAMERGEVQGMCGADYFNVIATHPNWLTDNLVKVISYQGSEAHPGFPGLAGVSPAVAFAKTDEQRQILNLYDAQEKFGRPYVTGAGVPRERIEALRTAFAKTMEDPRLRQDVQAAGLNVSPASGDQVQAMVADIYNTAPEIIRKTRAALGYE